MELLHEHVHLIPQALPQSLLSAIRDDADAISRAPNYWVPRAEFDNGESRPPPVPRSAVEAAVARLFHTIVHPRLAARGQLDSLVGAEFWLQIYEAGRGLGFHFDKDEFAMKERGELVTPLFSSVLYLTGDASADGARQGATAIVDQTWDYEAGSTVPPDPTHTLLAFPQANTYCLFDGGLAHGVLDSLPPAAAGSSADGAQAGPCGSIPAGARATLLVNWWHTQPQSVQRMEDGDVAAMRLAPPPLAAHDELSYNGSSSVGSGVNEGRVPVVELRIEVAEVEEGEGMLMMDDFLSQRGVALTGPSATHAVLIAHPGLAVCPIDTEQLLEQAAAGGDAPALHAAAALVPLAMLADSSSSDEEGDGMEEKKGVQDCRANACSS